MSDWLVLNIGRLEKFPLASFLVRQGPYRLDIELAPLPPDANAKQKPPTKPTGGSEFANRRGKPWSWMSGWLRERTKPLKYLHRFLRSHPGPQKARLSARAIDGRGGVYSGGRLAPSLSPQEADAKKKPPDQCDDRGLQVAKPDGKNRLACVEYW